MVTQTGDSTAEHQSSSSAGSLLSLKLVRAPILRAALLWLALHVFVATVAEGGFVFPVSMSRLIVLIAAAVGYFDSRRRREATFAGNLGIPPFVPPVMWAATTVVLEIGSRIAAALLE
jgi:hypothetical protein